MKKKESSFKFHPLFEHLFIEPEAVTNEASEVETEAGKKVIIYKTDRVRADERKGLNKGKIIESSSAKAELKKGMTIISYPYSANEVKDGDEIYHIVHERDVMGWVE